MQACVLGSVELDPELPVVPADPEVSREVIVEMVSVAEEQSAMVAL